MGIQRRWGDQRRAALSLTLRHFVILPFDAALTDSWAEIAAHRARIGRPISCGDCWIAASAIRHSVPLISHNGSHYAEIPGLRVITRAT